MMLNSNTWMTFYYDMWLNVSMPCGIKNPLIKIKILSW